MERFYKKLFFVLLLCFPATVIVAQSLTGKITDAAGSALPGIRMQIQGLTNTITNERGEYYFKLPSGGSYRLKISSAPYQSQTADIYVAKGNKVSNFVLKPLGTVADRKVVTGRAGADGISDTESFAPVDIISSEELKRFAQRDVTQILNYAMQSFSSNRQTLSGGTDHIDPVSLRGLGPDQLLVLVNGKRRHSTALVNVDGTFGRGAAGTDLNAIPVTAIERIEILRDGASAQYGSDAIAGVVNIILKDNSPFNMSMSFGESASNTLGRHFTDGKTFRVDYSEGISLAGRGSLNFSGQYLYRGATNRGGFDTRPLLYSALPVRGNCECEEDFQKRYGALKTKDDLRAFSSGLTRDNMRVGNAESGNGGFLVNGQFAVLKNAEAYLTAGYTIKTGQAAGFSRLPSQSTQIDPLMYPNGYLPVINSGVQDLSVLSGIRGVVAGWNYDLSHVTGKNKIDFNAARTLNASLPIGTSPDNFNGGDLYFRQNTSNLDLSRSFKFEGVLKSITTDLGAEFKVDNYEIAEGEELSYSFGQPSKGIAGRKLGSVNAEPGAQVFTGFTPLNALNRSRTNKAIYADLETVLGTRLRLGLGGRLEDYSDFGSSFSYKTSGRYNFYREFALRGTYATGFRAPSLHQQYFNNETTSFIQGKQVSTLIINSENPLAGQFGIGTLKPELSNSYSMGLTGRLFKNLTFSADAYQIDIDDRIILSGLYSRERNDKGVLIPAGAVNQVMSAVDPTGSVNALQFFSNAISTQTRGVDLVLSDRFKFRNPGQNILLSAALSLNDTRVHGIYASEIIQNNESLSNQLFNRQEQSRIESGIPNTKINFTANYSDRAWGLAVRTVRFGEVAFNSPFDPSNPESNIPPVADQRFSPKWITDLTLNYTFTNELNIAFGVSNLMDIYPDRLYMDPNNRPDNFTGDRLLNYQSSAARDLTANGRIPYSTNVTQFGFNGRHIFGTLTYSL